ncbi:ATP synthase subunit I [Mesobacillus jeotgali]|uniref:ATP synthase subunit I n=1 Tax=Mesobacillus jeotgali TaxID=129985 RepID=UPI001CFF278B|nr:ATP synthase subunit I [Mesobacillus jeotgali]
MEIQDLFIRQRKYIFTLLSLYVLGYGFTSYQSVFAGLIFGTSLSLFNLWLLARKMNNFGDSVVQGKKVRSLGSLSRLATGALAVIVAMEYPDRIDLVFTVLGLMTAYIVIMIDFFVQSFHLRK